jgi:hypothetical protein
VAVSIIGGGKWSTRETKKEKVRSKMDVQISFDQLLLRKMLLNMFCV